MKPFKTDDEIALKETKLVNIMDDFELDDSSCPLTIEKKTMDGSLVVLRYHKPNISTNINM